jgi:FkbM family methyltransferase
MIDRTMAGGLSFWFPANDEGVGSSLRSAGEFARPEVDLLVALHAQNPGLTFVDIGANIGAIALPVAARLPNTPVFACEAHPELHALLCANTVANRLTSVQALHAAVSDKDGITDFPAPPLGEARNFGATGFGSETKTFARVLLTTLDRLCATTTVGTIKINVEGHEPHGLAGGEKLIGRDRPAILFEAKAGPVTTANAAWLLERAYALYWFFAPFVTPHNVKRAPVARALRGDINILALPEGRPPPWPLPRLQSPAENWQARSKEMTYLANYGIPLGIE